MESEDAVRRSDPHTEAEWLPAGERGIEFLFLLIVHVGTVVTI